MYIREDIVAMLGLGSNDPVFGLFNIKEEREYSVVVNTSRGTVSLDSVSLVVLLDNELQRSTVRFEPFDGEEELTHTRYLYALRESKDLLREQATILDWEATNKAVSSN